MVTNMIFRTLCGTVTAIMAIYFFKREKKFISFLIGAVTGSAALFLVNKYGGIFDINVPLNLFNISGSVILGVPFVVFVVIMNFL